MGNKTNIFIATALAFFCFACGKELSPLKYVDYYEKNKTELVKNRNMGELSFDLEYLPTDVLAMREMNDPKNNFDESQFKSFHKNYNSFLYFTIKIRPNDSNGSFKKIIGTKENYSMVKQYLASKIQNDFTLEAGSKKIECGLMHIEFDLGLQNSITGIMSFEKPGSTEYLSNDITISYNDQLFQNGIIKFNYSKEQINNFPKIKT